MRYFFLALSIFFFGIQGMNKTYDVKDSIETAFFHLHCDGIVGNVAVEVLSDNDNWLLESCQPHDSLKYTNKIEVPSDKTFCVSLLNYGESVLEVTPVSSETDWSVKFSIKQSSRYGNTEMKFEEVSEDIKAAAYIQVVGGGVHYVFAIGKGLNSDISIERMRKVCPFGEATTFFTVDTMSGIKE